MRLTVSAPGKLMISGEYVVLEGAEALVAAVDSRVLVHVSARPVDRSEGEGTRSPDLRRLSPEALLTRELVEQALGPAAMDLEIDTSALRSGGHKLGLGSSAAVAAATAGAVAAWHGRKLHRGQILAWAQQGHLAVAPEGSGADVAASVLGGFVRFRRGTEPRAIEWPQGLIPRVVWTGEPARTSDLVGRVRALGEQSRDRYERALAPIAEASERLIEAFASDDTAAAIVATRSHGAAMVALGQAAQAPIGTPALERVSALAEQCGGAAKPSGAGGGDVAIALFADPEAADRFGKACNAAGLTLLSLQLGADGVRREPDRQDD